MHHYSHKKSSIESWGGWDIETGYLRHPKKVNCENCSGNWMDQELMSLPCLKIHSSGKSLVFVKIIISYHPDFREYKLNYKTYEDIYNPEYFRAFKESQINIFDKIKIQKTEMIDND